MNNLKIGKREHNKYQQKQDIMNTFIAEMEMRELHEIKVEDVCEKVGISKVTFFNYFNSKESVIEYFVYLWQYEISYIIDSEKLRGKDAIYAIFESITNNLAAQQIMNSLIYFFIKQKEYKALVVPEYELFLLNSKAYENGNRTKDIQNIFFDILIDEGYDNEHSSRIVELLIIGFYGVPIRCKIGKDKTLKTLYREYVDEIIDRH